MQKKFLATTAIAMFLIIVMAATALFPNLSGQLTNPPGTVQIPYPFVRAGPNPIGVGQTVTIIMFVGQPTLTSENVQNWTLVITTPDGTHETLGPFVSDTTGGTFTTYVPETTGNYTIQGYVGQQTLSNGVIWAAAESPTDTLVVQSEPVTLSGYPITPLPTEWWQTPVTAENVQNWYKISGPWLGYGMVAFAITGGYNNTQNMYNPYTESVKAGHILWTKLWAEGGVVGGDAGGTESSHFWSTSQYQPKFAPVIMNGKVYSTLYNTDTTNSHGVVCMDLYTGTTLWTLNFSIALVCGMETYYQNPNQYGTVGPYIVTMGAIPGVTTSPGTTVYSLWDALYGKYQCSIINAPSMNGMAPFGGPQWGTDENENLIAYYVNNTNANQPTLDLFNMTKATGMANAFGWGIRPNGVFNWTDGLMYSKPVFTTVDGGRLKTPLAMNGRTGNEVILTGGFTFGQFYGGLQQGFNYVAAMDAYTGNQLWIKNFTQADSDVFEPWTRTQMQIFDGLWVNVNMANDAVLAVNSNDGSIAWQTTLPPGINSQGYDVFNIRTYNGLGCLVVVGFGGDIWCINSDNGTTRWQTDTVKLLGNPGLETPYATWPLWVFPCDCITNDVGYFAVGHEYNPPLFHGAQLIALNMTDGGFIWSILDTSVESTSIAYGIMLSRNAYDNMIYAFGKGPSALTVSAPNMGVTTATSITITGTIMDVSPGTRAIVQPDETQAKQNEVALRFPNGVPAVSDESQSHWMEYVYQQQPYPFNTTGVPITISVVDSNGNFRQIGETTSDASGTWAFNWTPDIAGDFQVIANFAGSNSYYPSSATAYFYAAEGGATAGPSGTTPPGVATTTDLLTYITIAAVAIIIVIIIVGVVLASSIRRHR